MQLKTLLLASSLMALFVVQNSALASDFSIHPVYFNERMPLVRSGIEDSLIEYVTSKEVLGNDALAIGTLKGEFRVKIIGSTDNIECAGNECAELSLRRAKLVYSWMLAHGVSLSQLLPPEGQGSSDPIADNKTSYGRARNRHVEFIAVPISTSP